MKPTILFLIVLAAGTAANAQTAPSTAKPAVPVALASSAVKLPPGVPRVHGLVKTAFSLRYEDVKIGTGVDAQPNKLYKVLYSGYLAQTGTKFDSSDDHRMPVKDKDGKPVMGDDGKPKLGDPQPMSFPQGFGRLIPGFDQGFTGMKVGGKRRLFIPWQLAYGMRGVPGPDPAHPKIAPKSDLIFDVELVDVSEMPTPPARPMPNPGHPGAGMPPGVRPPAPGAPGSPAGATPPAHAPSAPVITAPQSTPPPPEAKPATPPPASQPSPQPQTPPQSK
jgi:peptidylprolyl isomerase